MFPPSQTILALGPLELPLSNYSNNSQDNFSADQQPYNISYSLYTVINAHISTQSHWILLNTLRTLLTGKYHE